MWLMVALKVPLGALLYIVWWAVHATDDEPVSGADGGSGVQPPRRPRSPGPLPRRRGPHGAPAQQAPVPRTRTALDARGPSRLQRVPAAGRH